MRGGSLVSIAALMMSATAARAANITAHYRCNDGSTLVATFVSAGDAPGSVTL